MDNEYLQITQEQIDNQNLDYDPNYLAGVEVGDWVYDDGEVLAGVHCVEYWLVLSTSEKHIAKNKQIIEKLEVLNSKEDKQNG